jgi:tRNA(fMet)-specific endonuclease VapC
VKLLIDTNAYAAFMRGDADVVRIVRGAERILLSTIVLGELLFGFRAGSRLSRYLDELDRFSSSPYVSIVEVTRTTSDRFSRVAAQLRIKGRPIPSNDLWIAAHALEHGADLLSLIRTSAKSTRSRG